MAPLPEFSYVLDNGFGEPVCRLSGDIDLASIAGLEAAIAAAEEAAPGGRVVLDMSKVTFLDSTGLKVLVAAHHRSEQDDRRLVLVRPADPVIRILKITGLFDVMHVDR